MSYLNITKDRIEQRLSYFRDKIKDETRCKVEENIERQKDIALPTFFISLIILAFSVLISTDSKFSALASTTSFYVGTISFMAFMGSMLLLFFTAYLENNEVRYFKKIYQKVCKEYCEQYRIDNLEDDSNLQKILTTIFADEFLEEKTDTEIYQHLYAHRMLRSEELEKIEKFLESNKINFKDYVFALDRELLARIISPYKDEIKREIEEVITSFFLEKDRAKQEEERTKSIETQKRNLFIEKTNGFASSMLGKNLAM